MSLYILVHQLQPKQIVQCREGEEGTGEERMPGKQRERERERQTDRQTDRQREIRTIKNLQTKRRNSYVIIHTRESRGRKKRVIGGQREANA